MRVLAARGSGAGGVTRGALHLMGNVAPLTTGLITAPMTARALGVEDRGWLVVAGLVGGLVTLIGAFGLGWAARAEVAADATKASSWDGAGRVIAALLAPIMLLVGWWGAALIGLGAGERLAAAVWLGTCAFGASRSVRGNVLIALGHPDRVGVSQTWLCMSTIGAVALLYFADRLNLASAIGAMTIGPVIQAAVLRRIWRQVGPADEPAGRPSLRVVLRKGRGAWGMQTIDGLSSRADSLVVLSGANSLRFGLYSVAAILPQVCFQIYLTVVQRSYAKNPRLELDRRTCSLVVVCGTVALPLAALGWAAGELFIPPVFGSAFSNATIYLAPAAVFAVALGLIAPIFADAAVRRGRYLLVGPAFALIVGAACASAAAVPPRISVFGLAVAVVVAAAVYLRAIGANYAALLAVRDSYRDVLRPTILVDK